LLSSIADPQVEVNVQVYDPEWLPPVRETATVPPVGLQQLVPRAMLVVIGTPLIEGIEGEPLCWPSLLSHARG
jgi:hypothetical protein